MALPASLVNERPGKTKTLIAAFEKELGHLTSYIRRSKHDHQFVQKSSNTIFSLWTEYGSKLPSSYLSEQQLTLGDVLYERGLYSLAHTHCYSGYLSTHLRGSSVMEAVAALTHTESIVSLLRAVIGDAMCRYHTVLRQDSRTMIVSSWDAVKEVLNCLQCVCEVALTRKQLYWIAHNTLSLSYSVCRRLMTHPSLVLDYLLWGAVAMESSVPLMASKYLTMRTNFYTGICYCYYRLDEPSQAELFARRSLDKVHELAQLEGGNTTQQLAYREASLKLGIVIFKRSVFVSRKKVRASYRPKIRPSLRELLQASTPRSPTERLAWELFGSPAAVFMALLETLSDPSRRPLTKGPPTHPTGTELDQDTITDIFQELFCLGLDLALSAEECSESGSLLARAVSGSSIIPVEALVRFVRVAYSADQREVIELLANTLIQNTQVSVSPHVKSLGKGLELVVKMDSLASLYKRFKSSLPSLGAGGQPSSLSELREDYITAEEVFSQLQDSLSLLHLSVGDESLLATDFDLLLDTGVLIWELVRPAFSLIRSHELDTCQQFLSQPSGTQYLVFLAQLVDVFHSLELWRVDPLLQGELSLKLATLYEARATLRSPHSLDGFDLLYDRALLLECKTQLERDVYCVEAAREGVYGVEGASLETLHSQFFLAQTRVNIKLASTIPPPCPPPDTLKPSSLHSKVAQRQETSLHRTKMLSILTAPTASVANTTALRNQCRANRYKRALVSMLQASFIPQLDQSTKTSLLEEAEDCLNKTTPTTEQTTPINTLPPPQLISTTNTSLTFEPVPFSDESLSSSVCYYRVFGRPAAGSNVRVRLSDHALPGTGVEVCVGERVTVRGLKTDVEYVFAVAGYSDQGELVGGSIGVTGRPLLASFSYPSLVAWGELCKAGFVCGVDSVAERAAERLWRECTPLTDDLLSSQHSATLHLLVQSVLIRTQLSVTQNGLFPDSLLKDNGTLRENIQTRLELAQRLVTVLTVCEVLNDRSLCLQTAVTVYGLLAPLLQYNIQSEPLLDVCLHCYTVLGEVIDPTHKRALHHLIAALGYYISKVAIDSGNKALFSLITDNVRSMLIATMPTAVTTNGPPPPEGLQQASLLSSSGPGSSDTATVVSGPPPSLLPQPGNKRRRARNRRQCNIMDEMTDDSKSVEYRAFEGFLLSRAPPSEEIELSGSEDPILLHAIIATYTSNSAHKELFKFRRRPQYLEYFVHLATATLNKGHTEKVFGWCRDAFTWVSRRNELLLSPKQGQSKHPRQEPGKQNAIPKRISRGMSAMGSSFNMVAGKGLSSSLNLTSTAARRPSKLLSKQLSNIGSSLNISGAGGKQNKRSVPREMSSCGSSFNVGRRPSKIDQLRAKTPQGKAVVPLPPGRRGRILSIQSKLHLDTDIKITRDDVEFKACAIISSLLPTVWRTHRVRKRLRSVCTLELPWRAQANIISATCHLESLCGRLTGGGGGCGLTLDQAGCLIEGAVPVYTNALAGTKTAPPASPSPALSELRVLMLHYRRAVTLAHRGAHWILLQNTVRSLLNAITCLRGHVNSELVAPLYGEALYPLYFAVNALSDMLLNSGVRSVSCESVCLVRRTVLLAVHVLHVHQHWEKVVSIIVNYNNITKQCWSSVLSPVLSVARTNLSQRLTAHKELDKTRIHPAAHLDPGPEGYDIYHGVGHSLGLSLVSTAADGGDRVVGRGLERARSLCSLYMCHHVGINQVIEAYHSALDQCKEADQLTQAMSELGDLLLSSNASSQWWVESLCLLLGVRDVLTQWRQCSSTLFTSLGLTGALLAGQLAYKLARYCHSQKLDERLEYTLLAASLFTTILSYAQSTPLSPLTFIHLPTDTELFPGLELFANEILVSAPSLLASLSWTLTELLDRQYTLTALPVLWLYHHVAVCVCRDIGHTVHASILRLQALTQLHCYQEALHTLSLLLTGSGLPQSFATTAPTDKQTDTLWVLSGFSNTIPLTDVRNMKCIHAILEHSLSPALTELYGPSHVQHLNLVTAQLYITLAEGISPLHSSATTLCRPPVDTLKPLHSPSSTGASALSGSTILVGSASRPHTPSSASSAGGSKRHKNILSREALLECAERLLVPLSEDSLATHSLLELSRVARVSYHNGAAIALSLTAVRRQQAEESVCDPRHWLECLVSLAQSLLGVRESGGLTCEEVSLSAGEQAEALGDYELAARLHYVAALTGLSQTPQQLPIISQHCQSALRLLEIPRELSCSGSLLRCHVTLLLVDVTCVSGVGGVNDAEMVKVCQGLVGMLKQQLTEMTSDPEDINIFLPHRLLLASTNLRLAYCLIYSADSAISNADSALAACEEGLLMLQQSSVSDLCTQAELHALMGWVKSLSDESSGVGTLIEAVGLIAEAGIDSRLAVNTLYKLSELTCPIGTPSKVPSPTPPDKRRDEGRTTRKNRDNAKPVTCNSWLFLKLASRTDQYMEILNQFVSQVSNEEATKPLLLRILSELPDFVLAYLSPISPENKSLWTSVSVPSLKTLLPSSQTPCTSGLTFIKLAGHLRELLSQCFWQKASLGLTASNWCVHTHTLSHQVYPLVKALCVFLSTHSAHLRGLKPPTLPGARVTPEQHLTASENELTVVWTSPYPTEALPEAIVGYFALNAKPIRSGSVGSDALLQGVGCHVIKTTLTSLEEVGKMWEDLGELMNKYLDNKTRPVSRSPTKQKKSERSVKVSQETMDTSARAVDALKALLCVTTSKSPRLELSSVVKMAPLLIPYSRTTVRGELYHFFKTLLDTLNTTN